MTSDSTQSYLSGKYGSIPPTSSAVQAPQFNTPELTVLKNVLATSAAPLPQVPAESQFETLVGAAMKTLFADATSGPVSASTVEQQLSNAQQQMSS
jgi:multiple sugar transport system substrate-binding protein